MLASYPHALIEASGEYVGLPKGQMGNSEVGHTNIGAGRVVMQLLGLLEQAVADDSFKSNPSVAAFAKNLKDSGGTCHLWGLVSDGGVHSHISHIISLAKAIESFGVRVLVHTVTDGRDTDPHSGEGFVASLVAAGLHIATISGRYYAMDRNMNLDRTAKAVAAVVAAEGARFSDPVAAVKVSYKQGVTDEFLEPSVAEGYHGVKPGDGLLIANFRADRVRQTAAALAPEFQYRLGIAEYGEEISKLYGAVFPAQKLEKIFGEVISAAGLSQLRIAETEKYAHVTFFFNGGEERRFKGEERILIPSPDVATYDLKPEMSAAEITKSIEGALGRFDVIVANYANGDMVGHTGIEAAAAKAAGTVDICIGRLEQAVKAAGGVLIITADHGNCEKMKDERGNPFTAHTSNPVEFIVIGMDGAHVRSGGRLCDIAPTMLKILGLAQPAEMTGKSLI
jgi:2,3-bisphosphoglycerate-independent phosphoglycerate mutase